MNRAPGVPRWIRSIWRCGAPGATLLALAWGAPAAAERVAIPGDRVAVHNLVGRLTVVRGEGRDVVAEIERQGRDGDRLRVVEGAVRGVRALRVIYPESRIHVGGFAGRSTFWVREDGTLDGRSGEGHRVEITGRGDGLEARADVRLYVPEGKRVDVHWGHGSGDVRGISATLAIDGASLDVSAASTEGTLSISVGSGTVRVASSRGQIHVETGSGDVDVRQSGAQRLAVETGSGTIRASELDAPSLSLETGSGDIVAETIRSSNASLETGSGEVNLRLTSDIDRLSVESGSGDLTVSVPGGLGAAIHMETGSGSIESNAPIQVTHRNRRELNGTLGDGRGRLSLETGSGTVSLVSVGR